MSWTRLYYDLKKFVPPGSLSDTNRTYEANSSIMYRIKAGKTGTLRIRQTWIYTTGINLYISDNNSFDESTGAPSSYLATAQDTLTYSVAKNSVYYITVQGTSSATRIDTYIDYTSVNYESYLIENISTNKNYNWAYFDYQAYVPETYSTLIVPMTFPAAGTCRFTNISRYGQDWAIWSNVAVNSSLESVSTSTGLPATDIGTHGIDVSYEYIEWTTVPETTYYVYFVLDVYSRCFFQSQYKWHPTTTTTVSISVAGRDQFGRTFGDPRYEMYRKGSSEWPSPYQYGAIRLYINSFTPNLTYDGHTYKRAKFVGWYDSTDFTRDPLSTHTNYRNINITTSKTYYAYFELTDDEFEFTDTVVSGGPFNIKADDWNNLLLYAQGKSANVYDRQQDSSSQPLATNYWQTKTRVDSLYTAQGYTALPPTTQVSAGDAIYAYFYNNLLTEIRSLT